MDRTRSATRSQEIRQLPAGVVEDSNVSGLEDPRLEAANRHVIDRRPQQLHLIWVLAELGCTMGDVIMTRVYVQNSNDIQSVAVVHGETFRDIRPASTIVKVDFIDPKILVEIEAEAVYGGADEKASTAS